ncbi:MAG: serine--tRNA ligase [Xanthobacteraceae bacterium]|nr:serine--tRNA ligase [Xanthobacteraceae bacterium]
MHDIRSIRENADAFDRALARRNLSDEDRKRFSSQNLLSIDERRRAILRVLEREQAQSNTVSREIGQAKANKDEAAVRRLMEGAAESKSSISRMQDEERAIERELFNILAQIPNLPLDDVPQGTDANDNVEHHRFGARRDYSFKPKEHFILGEALNQMDFEAASKISGARFVVLKSGLARLERALGQFMLDVHTSEPHNYTEVAPPLLVRDEAMFGTAQLPKFELDQFESRLRVFSTREFEWKPSPGKNPLEIVDFKDERLRQEFLQAQERYKTGFTISNLGVADPAGSDQLLSVDQRVWLIPTAEVPLTNLVRESIVDEAQLPMRVTACTPCFRAEAGAAGKDTRGMIRQHQFTKVELVSITTPEQSKDEHERMLSCAEEVLRRLDLHYRVMTLCAGDMGFATQKTYDIEVWLPGQGMYREISSCSNCGEFQARRMNARYRGKADRNVRHVHTLNGSGVAVGRALIAVMETYQQNDGSIAVPEALGPYMGGITKIEK